MENIERCISCWFFWNKSCAKTYLDFDW